MSKNYKAFLTLFLTTFLQSIGVRAENLVDPQNALDLYSYPPTHKIDWSTPRNALASLVVSDVKVDVTKNSPSYYRSLVGHALVHFRCTDSQGRAQDQWAGLTGQNKTEVDKNLFFHDQVGLGVLFYEYVDGAIDPPEHSRYEVTNYIGRLNGPLTRVHPEFLRTPLNPAACDRIVKMADDLRSISYDGKASLLDLQNRPVGSALGFGFTFDPYNDYLAWLKSDKTTKIGGGCASLATAFLKMAGNFQTIFEKRWTHTIDIGESRIGGVDPNNGTSKQVSMLQLLGPLGSQWKDNDEPSRKLFFYDPELMWSFIRGARLCATNERNCTAQSRTDLQALQNAGLEAQGTTEIFDQVKKHRLDSRILSKIEGSPATATETAVTRDGLQLR